MSFVTMDNGTYINGLIGIYELNNVPLLRDLDRIQEATIVKDGKSVTTRTVVAGQVGRVFQAAGVALPPNMREHQA